MDHNTLTLAGLGAGVLGVCLYLFKSLTQRAVKRSDSEGSLDDRVIRFATAFETLLDDERSEKKRLQEELYKTTDRFYKMLSEQQMQQQQTIEKIRIEHREATQHIHNRLDHCERQHAACEAQSNELRGRVEAAEAAARQGSPVTIVNSPTGTMNPT